MDILKLSSRLRGSSHTWKTDAHGKKNKNKKPKKESSVPQCQKCAHLEDMHKCIQYHMVQESGLKNIIHNKLVLPEALDVINPLV